MQIHLTKHTSEERSSRLNRAGILGVFEILRFTRSARKPLGLPPSIGETIQLSNNKFSSNTFQKCEIKSKFSFQPDKIKIYHFSFDFDWTFDIYGRK